MTGPNPFRVVRSLIRARAKRSPQPTGTGVVDHADLGAILDTLASGGIGAIGADHLDRYLARLATIEPDALGREEALAYWINLYNAGTIAAAARAYHQGLSSVLRVRGAFTDPFVTVAGEALTLDDVEHGKIRRFGDPRIHAALVCGSVSCPSLRHEPFRGAEVDRQLDDQMRRFLATGGLVADRDSDLVTLSRVFRWYGPDFVRPNRMPSHLPVRATKVVQAIGPWMEPEIGRWVRATRPSIRFQEYDWTLGCVVQPPADGDAGSIRSPP